MIDTVIFDLDGVLCEYNLRVRLEALSDISGRPTAEIRRDLWDSGFEEDADTGRYPDADDYLKEFGDRLKFPVTREQWIEARRRSMRPYDGMLQIVAGLKRSKTVAILTNNVPLLRETLPQVFAPAIGLFGDHIYFSCDFGIGKPDPELFRQVASRCGANVQGCLFTDDMLINVKGARDAGMQGIHFTGETAFRDRLSRAGMTV